MPAVCVKDVDQQEFVKAFAAFLKKSGKVKVPSWADQVKTAVFKELSPYDQDWLVKIISDSKIGLKLGTTCVAPHWPVTCTCAVMPVSAPSARCTVAPRTMASPHPTSASPTVTSSAR